MFEAEIKKVLADMDAVGFLITSLQDCISISTDAVITAIYENCLEAAKGHSAKLKKDYDCLIAQAVEEAEIMCKAYDCGYDNFEDELY